jgi:hypothetical protein
MQCHERFFGFAGFGFDALDLDRQRKFAIVAKLFSARFC